MTPREIAQRRVDKFNDSLPPKSKVTYFKSDIEGRQITTVVKPAYIQGDDIPVVLLEGIGIALIEKIESYEGNARILSMQKPDVSPLAGWFIGHPLRFTLGIIIGVFIIWMWTQMPSLL